jgi:hypothetical protein
MAPGHLHREGTTQPGDGDVVPDGSIVRDVAAKRAVILGGLPAVLLQLAHPVVAQGYRITAT